MDALDRWRLGLATGLFALFLRELALPYCLIALFLAWRQRRREEIVVWMAGLILYGMCCLAAWGLRRRGVRTDGEPLRVPGSGPVPFVACAIILWLLTSITWPEWRVAAAVIGLAALLFVMTKRRRARAGNVVLES